MKLTSDERGLLVIALEMASTTLDRQSNRLTVPAARAAVAAHAAQLKALAVKLGQARPGDVVEL